MTTSRPLSQLPPEEIDRFVREHQERSCRFVEKRGFTRYQAEDLTQETFLQLCQAKHPIHNLGAYFYATLRHRMADHRRKTHARTNHGELLDQQVDDSDPFLDIEQQELLERLADRMQQLDLEEQLILKLSSEGKSWVDIHRYLRRSFKTLKKKYLLAKARLKALLDR